MDLFEERIKRKKISTSKEKEKIKQILKDKGINIDIEGCGCCGSSWVTFEYDGEMILEREEYFTICTF